MQPTLTVSHFSDVLCVWAYPAQIKLDELQRQFGDQICIGYSLSPPIRRCGRAYRDWRPRDLVLIEGHER